MGTAVFGITGIESNGEEMRIEIDGKGGLPDFVPPIIGRGVKQFGLTNSGRKVTAVLLFYHRGLNRSRVRGALVVKRTGQAVMVDTVTFLLIEGAWEQSRNSWSDRPLCIRRL